MQPSGDPVPRIAETEVAGDIAQRCTDGAPGRWEGEQAGTEPT